MGNIDQLIEDLTKAAAIEKARREAEEKLRMDILLAHFA